MPIQGLKISLTIGLTWVALFIAGFILFGLFFLFVLGINWYCKMQHLDPPKKLNDILNKILEVKK